MALKIIARLLIFGVALTIMYFWLHGNSQETRRREQADRDHDEQIRQHISQFAARYDAVSDWPKDLNSAGSPGRVFSAELTPLLVRRDRKPVLFIVTVTDVSTDGLEQVIHFEVWVNLGKNFNLRLHATPEQVKVVMAERHRSIARYAIVAHIESVTSLNDDNEELRPLSLAEGQCVDVLPLGLDPINMADLQPKVSSTQ